MNRKSFLTSFAALFAAPSILAEVNSGNITVIESIKREPEKIKLQFHIKFPIELLEDEEVFYSFVKNSCENYDIWTEGKLYHFDLSKPYQMRIGWHNDDFSKNFKSCIITQSINK